MRPSPIGQRRDNRGRYTATRVAAMDADPVAGLFAVHAMDGSIARIYYCEPATGRCSCGVPAGSCAHIATVIAMHIRPRGCAHGG